MADSATGGYLTPTSTEPLPGGLSLQDFIQTVIVGVTGLAGTLVRPKWQINPPKQPDILTNWIAFSVNTLTPDAYAYVDIDVDDITHLKRNEAVEIQCSFYGPLAQDYMAYLRDGLQITQNLEAMRLAKMGYTGVGPAITGPDLLNERWVNRIEMTLFLTRQVQRVYPILAFASAIGSIDTVLASDEEYNSNWVTPEPTP